MDKEKKLKNKLYGLWKKEHIRITKMSKTNINLGTGVGKESNSIDSEKNFASNLGEVWETIKEFGIDPLELKAVKPTMKDLYEIYSAIKAYRISIRYLKMLKGRMQNGS